MPKRASSDQCNYFYIYVHTIITDREPASAARWLQAWYRWSRDDDRTAEWRRSRRRAVKLLLLLLPVVMMMMMACRARWVVRHTSLATRSAYRPSTDRFATTCCKDTNLRHHELLAMWGYRSVSWHFIQKGVYAKFRCIQKRSSGCSRESVPVHPWDTHVRTIFNRTHLFYSGP